MSRTQVEPLLTEDESRYVMFPIQDQSIWQMYKKQVDCFYKLSAQIYRTDYVFAEGMESPVW